MEKKDPVPNKNGEYFTSRLDVENSEKFPAHSFETALDAFYKIIQEHENED